MLVYINPVHALPFYLLNITFDILPSMPGSSKCSLYFRSLPFSKYQEASISVCWNTKTFPNLQCKNPAANNFVSHSHETFHCRMDWEVYTQWSFSPGASFYGCHCYSFLCCCNSALLLVVEGTTWQVWPHTRFTPREVSLCQLTSHN
jgi:hypothetical protein